MSETAVVAPLTVIVCDNGITHLHAKGRTYQRQGGGEYIGPTAAELDEIETMARVARIVRRTAPRSYVVIR